MAGMYPDNKEISSFGKTVKFPGVDESGKFTNGDFSNPDIPPSFLDADTINLVIDNLNTLVAHLGGNANNTDGEQLKKLFSITAEANKAIKRDSQGRAKVAAPVEDDDIARKAEIDAEAKARTQSMSTLAQSFQQAINAEAQARAQGDNAISGQLSSHAGNKSNPHSVTKAQVGLGNVDNTADKDKSVKYAGSARHSDTSNLLQAYTTDDYAGGNHFIKAIRESGWNMRLYGCYFNGAKQSDCVKVNYANSAGKAATADSAKNADTVGGYRAGNGVNMLVPVVAFNVGENAGYIKLGNGLIVQWGRFFPKAYRATLVLPIPFTTASYAVVTGDANGYNSGSDTEGYEYSVGINKRTQNSVDFSIPATNYEINWICIGY
ncbi:MAG: gp53-like domain-containing protein [Treponema sp.]